jgi:hypothetical protein
MKTLLNKELPREYKAEAQVQTVLRINVSLSDVSKRFFIVILALRKLHCSLYADDISFASTCDIIWMSSCICWRNVERLPHASTQFGLTPTLQSTAEQTNALHRPWWCPPSPRALPTLMQYFISVFKNIFDIRNQKFSVKLKYSDGANSIATLIYIVNGCLGRLNCIHI